MSSIKDMRVPSRDFFGYIFFSLLKFQNNNKNENKDTV